jgi:1,4-dihydroxy-2-naphthoyl-CoA hydrolase
MQPEANTSSDTDSGTPAALPSMESLQAVRERTIMGTLGIDLVEATPERVVLTMPVGSQVHQPYGLLHGGASVVLAETAASIGSWLAAGPDFATFGVEINANHLRSVRNGVVTATATPIRTGRTISVWDTEITDDAGRLVCVSRCTVAVRPMEDATR